MLRSLLLCALTAALLALACAEDPQDASKDTALPGPDAAADTRDTQPLPDAAADTPAPTDTLDTSLDAEVVQHPEPQLGWLPLIPDAPEGHGPSVMMKETTTRGLLVHFQIPGLKAGKVVLNDQVFHTVSIPGFGLSEDLGKPQLPSVAALVEVPKDVTLKLSVYKSSSQVLPHFRIVPAQALEIAAAPD